MFNGKILRHLRSSGEPSMTASDIAVKMGVTHSAVSNWENGIRQPESGHVEKLSKMFGVDIGVFFMDDDQWYDHLSGKGVPLEKVQLQPSFSGKRMDKDAPSKGVCEYLVSLLFDDLPSRITRPVFDRLYPNDGKYVLIINTLGKVHAPSVIKQCSDAIDGAVPISYNWVSGESVAVQIMGKSLALLGINMMPDERNMAYLAFDSDRDESELKEIAKRLTDITGALVFVCRRSLMSKGISTLDKIASQMSKDQLAVWMDIGQHIIDGMVCRCGTSDPVSPLSDDEVAMLRALRSGGPDRIKAARRHAEVMAKKDIESGEDCGEPNPASKIGNLTNGTRRSAGLETSFLLDATRSVGGGGIE